jgi:endo-1,4-beta-D-glucanase Y
MLIINKHLFAKGLRWGLGVGFACLLLLMGWVITQWHYVLANENVGDIAMMYFKNPTSVVNNPTDWLQQSWAVYRQKFIQHDGRVMDFFSDNATTSEGQSYALLRAVWLNDKQTFDLVWNWTQQNIQNRENDVLFAWKWGKEASSGDWKTLDATQASDADQDIALALLMANKRWGEARYKQQALAILADFWRYNVVNTKIGPVVLPGGDWYRTDTAIPVSTILNPSYFSPASYRLFASVDEQHPWQQLANTSYQVIQKSQRLGKTGLSPDWVMMNRSTGDVYLQTDFERYPSQKSTFGYEAVRTPWRIFLDVTLFPEESGVVGKSVIQKTLPTLATYIGQQGQLPGLLDVANGLQLEPLKSKAAYGALYPLLKTYRPVLVKQLVMSYDWQEATVTDDYYAQNWYWFGLALQSLSKQSYNERLSPLERLTFFIVP